MRADKARVLEYSDGTTYVYPYSPKEFKSNSNVLVSMIQRVMKHCDVADLSNTYGRVFNTITAAVKYITISNLSIMARRLEIKDVTVIMVLSIIVQIMKSV